jgi:uncharacterized protein with FMN-binding domain
MRRIALWFASTVSVVVLLFGYHTSTSGVGISASSPPAVISASSATVSTTSSSPKTATKKKATTTKKATSTTVTGEVAQTQWGPVQVELTISSGKITAVAVPQYPNGNGQDAQINSYALPTLIQETLSAQSASIDMVSGATFTSNGYLQSLQSALDKANL